MFTTAKLLKYRETEAGTELVISVPNKLKEMIMDKSIRTMECRFDDGRHISADQRKKCYAMFNDIALWSGNVPEYTKEIMKAYHIACTGARYLSLSDCNMDEAREFINTLLEFAIENGIPLKDAGYERTDDIDRYLWCCLRYRKCAICGKPGEIHHVDAIGMGRNRDKIDDSKHDKICLCREHHTICHSRGNESFLKMYKIHGIKYTDG